MTYEGKHVWTEDEFEYSKVQIGNYVEQAVVDNAMDCLPPAFMSSRCSQMGEPYSHMVDPDSGDLRATFTTFTKVAKGIWQYCGHCFYGETVERGKEPVWD